jgi:hypothetical protein
MNRWIADRGYGTGMALAFDGDKDFIRRSINFAINFLVHDASNIHQHSPSFVVVNTTEERLKAALYQEGYSRELLRLSQAEPLDNPLLALDDEDFPADFNERCEKFRADLWAAANPEEVAEVLKRDPTRGIFDTEPDEGHDERAKAWARQYVDEEMGKLQFEDFMRQFSSAGLTTHEVAETA